MGMFGRDLGKILVRIASVQAKFQGEHFQNASVEHYA
jgi:hypothetical protein